MRLLIAGMLVALAGCASKPAMVYWTEKGGTVSVHHVTGTVDKVQKLGTKAIDDDTADMLGLSKGKYFKVTEHVDKVEKPKADKPTEKKDKSDGSKDKGLAEVKGQLRDMKNEIEAVSAQNEQLRSRLEQPATADKSADTPAPKEEQEGPRESQ